MIKVVNLDLYLIQCTISFSLTYNLQKKQNISKMSTI